MKTNSSPSLKNPIHREFFAPRSPVNLSTNALDDLAVAIFDKKALAQSNHPQPEAAAHDVARVEAIQTGSDQSAMYKCKNCGKRMKLSEAANYYGLPACPVCVRRYSSFEIIPESPDSGLAENF